MASAILQDGEGSVTIEVIAGASEGLPVNGGAELLCEGGGFYLAGAEDGV